MFSSIRTSHSLFTSLSRCGGSRLLLNKNFYCSVTEASTSETPIKKTRKRSTKKDNTVDNTDSATTTTTTTETIDKPKRKTRVSKKETTTNELDNTQILKSVNTADQQLQSEKNIEKKDPYVTKVNSLQGSVQWLSERLGNLIGMATTPNQNSNSGSGTNSYNVLNEIQKSVQEEINSFDHKSYWKPTDFSAEEIDFYLSRAMKETTMSLKNTREILYRKLTQYGDESGETLGNTTKSLRLYKLIHTLDLLEGQLFGTQRMLTTEGKVLKVAIREKNRSELREYLELVEAVYAKKQAQLQSITSNNNSTTAEDINQLKKSIEKLEETLKYINNQHLTSYLDSLYRLYDIDNFNEEYKDNDDNNNYSKNSTKKEADRYLYRGARRMFFYESIYTSPKTAQQINAVLEVLNNRLSSTNDRAEEKKIRFIINILQKELSLETLEDDDIIRL